MVGVGLHCYSHATVILRVPYCHWVHSVGTGHSVEAWHGFNRLPSWARGRAEGGGDVALVSACEVARYRRSSSHLRKGQERGSEGED